MSNPGHYLRVLGFNLGSNPSPEEVKKRWKELSRKHHPDLGGDENKFKEITHAYKMLTDPSYKNSQKGLDKINLDIRIQFPVTFDEAFFGKTVTFNFNIVEFDDKGMPLKSETLEIESVTVEVNSRMLVNAESTLVEVGRGFRHNGVRGNCVLIPLVRGHGRFKIVKGFGTFGETAIVSEEQVPLAKMLKGGKIDVLTMYGLKRVKVRPGSAPGDKIAILGAGIGGGIHYVVLTPVYPKKEDLKKNDWKGLEIDWNESTSAEEPAEDDDDELNRYLNKAVRKAKGQDSSKEEPSPQEKSPSQEKTPSQEDPALQELRAAFFTEDEWEGAE